MRKLFDYQTLYERAVKKEEEGRKWQAEIESLVIEESGFKIGDRFTALEVVSRKDVTIIIDEISAYPSNYATKNLEGWTISMRGRKLKKDGTPSVYRETLFEWIKEDDI